MKVTPDHYHRIRSAILVYLDDPDALAAVHAALPLYSPKRLRWDLFRAATFDLFHDDTHPAYIKRRRLSEYWGPYIWILGDYKNAHLDTALRRVMRECVPALAA